MNRKLTKSIKHQSWLMDDPKNWQLMYSVGRSSCPIKWIECGTMMVEFLGMSPLQKTEKHVHVHHIVYIRFLKLLCQPRSIKVSRRKQFDTEFGSKAHAALLRRWLINYAYSFLLSVLYFHDHCKYPDVLDYSANACVWRERRVLELMFWFISWCCGHNFCCQYAGSFCCIQVLVFSIQLL